MFWCDHLHLCLNTTAITNTPTMIRMIVWICVVWTTLIQRTWTQTTLSQLDKNEELLQQSLLQPLSLTRQLQDLSTQAALLKVDDLVEGRQLGRGTTAEAIRLQQQLRTLQRQQQALQVREEARLRAERRRQQERTRLRRLRLQQESLRRQGRLPINNSDLLTEADIARNQALLQQTLNTNQGSYIPILQDERDGPFQDGTYYFKYTTGNGIIREEGSRLTGPYTHQVTGSYSYTAPNGELIIMEYIADENGYRAFPVRPDRASSVPRPLPIDVPPPYRPPLTDLQKLAALNLALTRTKRRDIDHSSQDLKNADSNADSNLLLSALQTPGLEPAT